MFALLRTTSTAFLDDSRFACSIIRGAIACHSLATASLKFVLPVILSSSIISCNDVIKSLISCFYHCTSFPCCRNGYVLKIVSRVCGEFFISFLLCGKVWVISVSTISGFLLVFLNSAFRHFMCLSWDTLSSSGRSAPITGFLICSFLIDEDEGTCLFLGVRLTSSNLFWRLKTIPPCKKLCVSKFQYWNVT